MVLIGITYTRISKVTARESVPLRGLWFLSAKKYRRDEGWENLESVPLRGLWFLSAATHDDMRLPADWESVPLRGLWFLSICNMS